MGTHKHRSSAHAQHWIGAVVVYQKSQSAAELGTEPRNSESLSPALPNQICLPINRKA